jgi:hypothetical protein
VDVFIAFTKFTRIKSLERTLLAWDVAGYTPAAVAVPYKKHDLVRQIAAEGLAKGDYIIADIGSSPDKPATYKLHLKGQDSTFKVEAWIKPESSPLA